MPAGKGLNPVDNLTSLTCLDANCSDCRLNYQVCTTCKTSLQYFKETPSNKCLLYSHLPDGFGGNNATGVMTGCSDTNCKKCSQNYQVCSECKPRYSVNSVTKACDPIVPPDGQGFNSLDAIVNCQSTACTDCKADYLVCQSCQPRYSLNSATKACDPIVPPAGQGFNSLSNLVPCADSNCTDCRDNYLDCKACKVDQMYYFNSAAKCVLFSDLDPGFGGASPSSQSLQCSVSFCSKCFKDYSKCESCEDGKYLLESSNSCLGLGDIQANYGVDTVAKKVVQCEEVDCSDCKSDFTQCMDQPSNSTIAPVTVCDAAKGYYLSGNTCLYAGDLPSGKGLDLSTGQVADCLRFACSDCRFDTSGCLACSAESNATLATVNGQSLCVPPQGVY